MLELMLKRQKPPPFLMRVFFSGGPTRTCTWDQWIMRADIQRKPLAFQELMALNIGLQVFVWLI